MITFLDKNSTTKIQIDVFSSSVYAVLKSGYDKTASPDVLLSHPTFSQ